MIKDILKLQGIHEPPKTVQKKLCSVRTYLGRGPTVLINFQRGPNSTQNSNLLYIFSVTEAVQEVHSCTSNSQFSWKEGRKEKQVTRKDWARKNSKVLFTSLVTCSGVERGNGDLSGNINWKQGDAYRIFQILKKLNLSMKKAIART